MIATLDKSLQPTQGLEIKQFKSTVIQVNAHLTPNCIIVLHVNCKLSDDVFVGSVDLETKQVT